MTGPAHHRLLVAALLALAVAGCTRPLPAAVGAPAPAPGGQEYQEVVAAATAYARSHARLDQFVVERPVLSGDYARVRVVPAQVGAPALWVFLVRQGVHWQGLTLGDRLSTATYDLLGIPADLRLPAAEPGTTGRTP